MLRVLICSFIALLPTIAQETGPSAQERLSAAALKYFTDVILETQNGDKVRLYSDLLKGKVVVINEFFATCKGTCPVIAHTLADLQTRLGDRVGKDVFLLSFSVDPETDTPEKLKAYAENFHAKPGWLFLTGTKANVDLALSKLGKVDSKETHQTFFIVGNERTGLWMKNLMPDNLEKLLMAVQRALDDKAVDDKD